MRRFTFSDSLIKVYDKIDEKIIDLKSGVMELCADIQRFFEINLGVQLTENEPIVMNDTFIRYFPNLAKMTPLQLEQLIMIFRQIRNVNSHLFLNVIIRIPKELQEFFNMFPAPQYDITTEVGLTVYGMFYVLAFLSQKHQLSSFITSHVQTKYFYCFAKNETSEVQRSAQQYFNQLCGKGKDTLTFKEPFDKTDAQTFNDTYRRYLTKIFFGIEKCILKWTLSSKKEPTFQYLLSKNAPFSKNWQFTSELIKLRSYWFRGMTLFDEITENNQPTIFSFEYFMDTIIQLKKLLTGYVEYEYVLQLITELGEKLVHFYLLRMVEESYKILDKRLFNEDKVETKIETLNRLMHRFQSVEPKYFEMAAELIGKDEISYFVNASRFSDLYPREMKTSLLKIIKITSNDNIKIGGVVSKYKEFCFAFVNVDGENMNTINSISPLEMHLEAEAYYSSKIGVYQVTL